jgi:Holliday junction resolvase RusA-like endonuclease
VQPVLTFQVFGKPRGKKRPRFRHGRPVYTPAQTVNYETAMAWRAKEVWKGREPLEGHLGLIVTAVFLIPKSWPKAKRAAAQAHQIRPTCKPDWDNIGKMTDALKGLVWKDDSQVVDSRVLKYYGLVPFLQVEVLQ